MDGLEQITAIRATINKGLSDLLKASFPNVIPTPRPVVVDQTIKDPNWLAGFTSAEGCILVKSSINLSINSTLQRWTINEKLD